MAQTTSVDSGNATLIKRGDAAPNAAFNAAGTPWTVYIRHRVTDYVNNSSSGYLNIFEGNCDPASTSNTQGGLFQLYYSAVNDEIRLYVGEAWTVVDSLVRSGGHTGWATYAFHCAGNITDPVEFSYVFDDGGTVTTTTIGSTNGGGLRQMLAIGGIGGEEPNNTRNATFLIYNRKLTNAEILQQRSSPDPIFTGSDLFFFNNLASATNPHLDQSGSWGGAGGHDFTLFNGGLASTVSDYPSLWDSFMAAALSATGTLTGFLRGLVNVAASMTGAGALTGLALDRAFTIDFGTTPTDSATAVVTGAVGVVPTSRIECWLMADSTPDHNADEHRWFGGRPDSRPIVTSVGTGTFTVQMQTRTLMTGRWCVRWTYAN